MRDWLAFMAMLAIIMAVAGVPVFGVLGLTLYLTHSLGWALVTVTATSLIWGGLLFALMGRP